MMNYATAAIKGIKACNARVAAKAAAKQAELDAKKAAMEKAEAERAVYKAKMEAQKRVKDEKMAAKAAAAKDDYYAAKAAANAAVDDACLQYICTPESDPRKLEYEANFEHLFTEYKDMYERVPYNCIYDHRDDYNIYDRDDYNIYDDYCDDFEDDWPSYWYPDEDYDGDEESDEDFPEVSMKSWMPKRHRTNPKKNTPLVGGRKLVAGVLTRVMEWQQ